MKNLIAVLALVSGAAIAAPVEYEIRFSKGVVRLTDKPCTEAKVASQIKPEYQAQFRAGTIVWEGVKLSLCWVIDPSDPTHVFLIDETGDRGTLPIAAFKPVGARI